MCTHTTHTCAHAHTHTRARIHTLTHSLLHSLTHSPAHSLTLSLTPTRTGTGKTTVARRVGQLFESLGLLSGSEVVSCSASDFVTGYANQSSGKTREMFEKALGQVGNAA